MKAFWILLVSIVLTGCTITVKPIPKLAKNRPHRAQMYAEHHKIAPNFITVDSDWIENYKAEERVHGYWIPDDAKIKSVGSKFSVPQSVIDHFSDMTRAKPIP